MKMLVIGSGGREHALAWKLAQSDEVETVFVAPGNAGTDIEPKLCNVAISATDISALLAFAQSRDIKLTLVGPEAPLVAGIVDTFRDAGLMILGPTKAAAQLEGSKVFAKDFLEKYQIPTASYQVFTQFEPAMSFVKQLADKSKFPIVIKADGLAAGKGVVIAANQAEAEETIKDFLVNKRFGNACDRIVIEEFLDGEEASFMLMLDGNHILALATSQDHKARDNGDNGPNTGGMGAYSPAPVVTPELHQEIMQQIVAPTLKGLEKEGIPYTGFLYVGLMIDKQGQAKVLEFNCRLGDPETQPIMLRLKSDLANLCLAACQGQLNQVSIVFDDRPALGVVLAAGGYPNDYRKGDVIDGLDDIACLDAKVFHAGTQRQGDYITTNGGRVLCATALGKSIKDAQIAAYELVDKLHWDDVFFRTDIGYRALERN